MTTPEKRIYDGNRAKELLENEVFQQVFADIENEVTEEWKKSPKRDVEGREKLHQYLSILHKFKAQVTTTLETGKLAQMELAHKSKAQQVKEYISGNW